MNSLSAGTHILFKLLTQHGTFRQLVPRLGRFPIRNTLFPLALDIGSRGLARLSLCGNRSRRHGERRSECLESRDALDAWCSTKQFGVSGLLEFEVGRRRIQVGDYVLLFVQIL